MPLEPVVTKLEKIFELTPTVRTFRLRFPEGKWAPFKAGQFCMVQVPDPSKDGPQGPGIKKKAYSICSAPFETGAIDLCIKLVEGGMATNWFWTLKEGDPVALTVPYGGFVMKEPLNDDFVFVATGTGLAPLRSMIKTLLFRPEPAKPDSGLKSGGESRFSTPMPPIGIPCERQILLIFGVRYEDEILYGDEFHELEKKHPNFRFIPTISRPRDPKTWKGEAGYVQDKLKKYVTGPKGKRIYVCGLIPMIEAVQKAAEEIGFDKKQVHFEKYV